MKLILECANKQIDYQTIDVAPTPQEKIIFIKNIVEHHSMMSSQNIDLWRQCQVEKKRYLKVAVFP